MKRLLGILFSVAVLLAFCSPSQAQVFFVTSCGTVPTSLTTPVAGNAGMFFVDTTGKLCTSATGGSGGTSSNFGSAFPTPGTAAGFTDGTNMVAAKVRTPGSGATISDPAVVVADPNVLSALNTGFGAAATAANQTTANTALAAIQASSATTATNSGAPLAAQSTHTVNIGAVDSISQYPATATPITASAIGTIGATTATLAGTTGKTTFICGYSIRANATSATTVTNTITGVITATLSSIMWVAPAASGIGVDEQIFSPCIPASTTNTAIAVVSGAPGTGGNVSSRAWGYQL